MASRRAVPPEFDLRFPESGLQGSLRTVNSVADLVESLRNGFDELLALAFR